MLTPDEMSKHLQAEAKFEENQRKSEFDCEVTSCVAKVRHKFKGKPVSVRLNVIYVYADEYGDIHYHCQRNKDVINEAVKRVQKELDNAGWKQFVVKPKFYWWPLKTRIVIEEKK